MSRKPLFIGLIVLLAVLLLLWWMLSPSPQEKTQIAPTTPHQSASPSTKISQSQQTPPPLPPTQPIEERRKVVVEKVQEVLAAPITFYGKVIDQNGGPVPDATVNYGALDKFDEPGSQYQGKSDANGNFSINGIHGAVLRVGVQKKGYYMIDGKSADAFAYGIGPDSNSKPPPTEGSPAVFVLQKMGTPEPLIRVSSRQFDVPVAGRLLSIDLATGQMGQGNLQIESWLGDVKQRRFDWRYRLSVPGGGMVERAGQFEFEAPNNGYQPAVEVDMSANAERWSSDVTKNYFVKLSDGRLGRFSISFYPGDRNFVVIESYINPTPANRNLEFDPKKVVRSP
jgi:hypothetical protein